MLRVVTKVNEDGKEYTIDTRTIVKGRTFLLAH